MFVNTQAQTQVPQKALEVYEARVIRHADACWGWAGKLDKDGYGIIQYRENGERVTWRIHRLSFAVCRGALIEGLMVLHEVGCASRACSKPSCLYQGDACDNANDTVESGNHRGGANLGQLNHNAVLTADEVKEMKIRLRAGWTVKRVAEYFERSYFTVWNVKAGRAWKEVE